MEQFTIRNLLVRVAGDIDYVWVIIAESTDRAEFAASLGDAAFHDLLRRKNVRHVLVDCTKMWSFGIPEMSEYLDREFTAQMAAAGVGKIAVVLGEQAVALLGSIFDAITANHAGGPAEIRFFGDSQFYESFESVAWFSEQSF